MKKLLRKKNGQWHTVGKRTAVAAVLLLGVGVGGGVYYSSTHESNTNQEQKIEHKESVKQDNSNTNSSTESTPAEKSTEQNGPEVQSSQENTASAQVIGATPLVQNTQVGNVSVATEVNQKTPGNVTTIEKIIATETNQPGQPTTTTGEEPVKPIEDPKDPVKPIEDPKEPVKPIEDPKDPVKPIEDPKEPVKPIEDPKDPVKPIEDPKNPVKPIVTVTKNLTVTTVLNFGTEYRENPLLPVGTQNVIQEGKEGTKTEVFEIKLVNGVEQSRTLIETNVIPSTPRIIEVGTKVEEKVPQTTKEVTVRTETINFTTETRYNNELLEGTTREIRAGKNGSYRVVRTDVYEGDKLVSKGVERQVDRVEAVNRIVEVGTKKPQTTKRVDVRTEKLPYKTITRENPTLKAGERRVAQKGVEGSQKVVRDDIYEGEKLVSTGKEYIVEKVDAVDEIIEVGTKVEEKVPKTTKEVTVRTETINFTTETRYNNELLEGTTREIRAGKNGSYRVVRTDTYEGDKLVSQGVERQVDRVDPVSRIVEVGTKKPQTTKEVTVRTETINFTTETRYNNELLEGTTREIRPGKNGSYRVVRTDTYEGDKLVSQGVERQVDRVEPVSRIIEVGTKKPQTTKEVTVRTETINFTTETRYNNELLEGTTREIRAGKNGSYRVVRTDVYEGDKLVSRGTERQVDRVEAVSRIVEVGTKKPQTTKEVTVRTETINFTTETRYNNELLEGTTREIRPGKNGSYRVVRTDTYEGDKLVAKGTERQVDRVEAVNRIIEVGTKKPQTTKEVTVRTETINFTTETRYNSELLEGTTKEIRAGKNGSYRVVRTDTYEGDKLVAKGTERQVDRVEAVNRIVEIGTKKKTEVSDGLPTFSIDEYYLIFADAKEKELVTKLFGKTEGTVTISEIKTAMNNPILKTDEYKKYNLSNFFITTDPAAMRDYINDYAIKNEEKINRQFLKYVNEARRKVGRQEAIWAKDFTMAGQYPDYFIQEKTNQRAKEMADYGSLRFEGKPEGKHKRPDGRSWYTVYTDEGLVINDNSDFRHGMAGENALQSNEKDFDMVFNPDKFIKDAFDAWMLSPGHRALIEYDVKNPIVTFSYRQGLKDYFDKSSETENENSFFFGGKPQNKRKPLVAFMQMSNFHNPLNYLFNREEYLKWREKPENKDKLYASDEYYNYLKSTENRQS